MSRGSPAASSFSCIMGQYFPERASHLPYHLRPGPVKYFIHFTTESFTTIGMSN